MPDNDQPIELEAFEVEITDLDSPRQAQRTTLGRLSSVFLRALRPEHRRAHRWLSSVAIASLALLLLVLLNPSAGVAALLATHWPFQPSSTSPAIKQTSSGQVSIRGPNEIHCLIQTAWSPNSVYVALLGYTQPCDSDKYVPAQIDLYTAATARQTAHWQPDQAILLALHGSPDVSPYIRALMLRKPLSGMPPAYSTIPAIQYTQMLWSPSNAHLAISFVVVTRALTYEGLFLAEANGSHTRVLLHPQPSSDADPTRLAPLEWNLRSGSASELKALKPALTYTWDTHDHLVPLASLGTRSEAAPNAGSPIGNPDGDHVFSIWQPGRSVVLSLMHLPGAYLWRTNFAAWSPDSYALVTNFTFTGLMEPQGRPFPTTRGLNAMEVQDVPHLPAHDPALIPASAYAWTMAWNPTGTILAVYNLTGVVDLYNCYTGNLVRTLTPPLAQPLSGEANLLSWSPDGRFLLLSSAQWGLLTLWGPGSFSTSGKSTK